MNLYNLFVNLKQKYWGLKIWIMLCHAVNDGKTLIIKEGDDISNLYCKLYQSNTHSPNPHIYFIYNLFRLSFT